MFVCSALSPPHSFLLAGPNDRFITAHPIYSSLDRRPHHRRRPLGSGLALPLDRQKRQRRRHRHRHRLYRGDGVIHHPADKRHHPCHQRPIAFIFNLILYPPLSGGFFFSQAIALQMIGQSQQTPETPCPSMPPLVHRLFPSLPESI